jgi:hypothetical protein
MKIVGIICLIFFSLLQSCEKDDCSNVLCAPNSTFKFELVNTNGENLLSNGTIQMSDIRVINTDNQSSVEFTLINENSNDLIEINSIDIPIGTINYIIQASEIDIFGLFLINERNIGECCDVTNFSELRILDSEFLFDETIGVYTFLIE